jgi:D-serine deaminase-like pyridoxal phosphate-dependent protein
MTPKRTMRYDLPTPALLLDAEKVRRNLRRMADYAAAHLLKLRPHTKTHKSVELGRMQIGEGGASGLTVAKAGEASVMSEASEDLLIAYPTVDARRCAAVAEMGQRKTVRVGLDSADAADALSSAATTATSTIGVLVELDVGMHRVGVQTPKAALDLATRIDRSPGLHLDGLMFYPGHIGHKPDQQAGPLAAVEAMLTETLDLFRQSGLNTSIVSGGSTPTALRSHLVRGLTEIRPGTYIFNDMNCVHGGFASLDDCAARIICTVVSNAVPGQVVIDAGTKTLTSDRCGPAPDSGHGHVVEYPGAKITRLTEEHGQVDVTSCDRLPKLGEQVTVIPNHICPCVNLQDCVYWHEADETPRPMTVDARGRVF